MSTRNISWRGKGGRCIGLTTLPPSYANCLEICKPQPPGTLRACPGLQWDCFTLRLTFICGRHGKRVSFFSATSFGKIPHSDLHAKCPFTVLFETAKVRQNLVKLSTKFIESRWGRDYPHLSRPTLGPTDSYTMDTGSFPGVKRPQLAVDHPPLSSAEVKGRVEVYIYSPSGPSWPVLG